MGIFGKLFKGPEIDQAKSADSKQKMRRLFDSVVPDGRQYQLVAAYTEDAKRFNYGLVHGSKTTYGSLIVGWRDGDDPTVAVVPRVGSSGSVISMVCASSLMSAWAAISTPSEYSVSNTTMVVPAKVLASRV